jgi:AcrR family transcriptional regulator
MNDSQRRRSRQRLEERERVILDAATRLFASHGFHASSTRRIAAAAGVSEGTVFHYFGSKNELMLGILDRFYDGVLNPGAATILDTVMGTRERLRALALHHCTALAADSALMMRLLQVYAGVDLEIVGSGDESPLRALNRRYVAHLDRALREGMERGELRRDVSIRAARDLFFGTLEYGLRSQLQRRDGASGLADYVDLLLAAIWQGIRHPGTSSERDPLARVEAAAQQLETLLARFA